MEQRDQVVAHLQQYCAGYQALASEREQLHHQYLQQSQLMDRLQHDESHSRVQLEMSHSQLKQAQVCVGCCALCCVCVCVANMTPNTLTECKQTASEGLEIGDNTLIV